MVDYANINDWPYTLNWHKNESVDNDIIAKGDVEKSWIAMVAIPAENQISTKHGAFLKKCLTPTFLGGHRKLGSSKAPTFPKSLLCRELLNQVFFG